MKFLFCMVVAAVAAECGDGRCSENLAKADMRAILHKYWQALAERDSVAAVAVLDPAYTTSHNGVESANKWATQSFMEGYLKKVQPSDMALLSPLSLIDDVSCLTTINSGVTLLKTGEFIPMGPLSAKYIFTQEGTIKAMHTVGPSRPVNQLAQALSPSLDLKALTMALLNAFSSSEPKRVVNVVAEQMQMSRNGQPDGTPWGREKFLEHLFSKAKYGMELVELAIAGAASVHAHTLATVSVISSGEEIVYYDSWFINFGQDGKVVSIDSVIDTRALSALERGMAA